jgi:ABC-type bacteriocin/lantibiotic exporter with double-glycine peptidase domain
VRKTLVLALLFVTSARAGETTCPLTPDLQVPVATDQRTYNQTGVQCVWCSISTLAKYQGITAAANLTDRYKGQSHEGEVKRVLDGLGVKYKMQSSGNRDPKILKDACARRWGAAVGMGGTHMINVVHYAEGQVGIIDNCDRSLSVKKLSEQDFLRRWDGWAIVLIPPCGE